MAKGRPKKDRWADLPKEFQEAMASATDEKLNEEIKNAALAIERLTELKKSDEDLAQKKFAYNEAGAVYKEGFKAKKLAIAYCRAIKLNRGGNGEK